MQRIVIDTNVLLTSIGKQSPNRWLRTALQDGICSALITNDMTLEYMEIISSRTTSFIANAIISELYELPATVFVTPYFR
jgi:uncharacterized protein